MQLSIDEIVSTLNNWMEDELWEYYTHELECKREEIVSRFGFAYSGDRIYAISDDYLDEVNLSIKELTKIIKKAKRGDKEKKIETIESILLQIS